MSATHKVAELLLTEVGMRHELWESCSLDDPDAFRNDAIRLLGDLTEISSRDLRDADWDHLWRDALELDGQEAPNTEPEIRDICGDDEQHFLTMRALLATERTHRAAGRRAGLFDALRGIVAHFDNEDDALDYALRQRKARGQDPAQRALF
ncbi:hypothetical protein ACFY12_25780 [Streptomyces sp. NPDC001339]|uniref:hypothetical protein n=1 Tax=Streptomyces sp. NPDC001339 TaxID=3364563 RepID=UPI0036AA30BE